MKIEFIASTPECGSLIPPPKPARHYIPDWYYETPNRSKEIRFQESGQVERNVRACVPFLDALRTGWIQETWCDIYISTESGELRYNYSTTPQPIRHREFTTDQVRVSDLSYEPVEMTWATPWIPRTPKGWSVLFTSPLNRHDLPFRVMTGIIDSDRFFHTPMGQVPFHIARGFSGLIPAGTPMYQMIPIRREKRWESRIVQTTEVETRLRHHSVTRKFRNAYKESFWIPKQYE